MDDLPIIPFEYIFVIMCVIEVFQYAVQSIDLDGMI